MVVDRPLVTTGSRCHVSAVGLTKADPMVAWPCLASSQEHCALISVGVAVVSAAVFQQPQQKPKS